VQHEFAGGHLKGGLVHIAPPCALLNIGWPRRPRRRGCRAPRALESARRQQSRVPAAAPLRAVRGRPGHRTAAAHQPWRSRPPVRFAAPPRSPYCSGCRRPRRRERGLQSPPYSAHRQPVCPRPQRVTRTVGVHLDDRRTEIEERFGCRGGRFCRPMQIAGVLVLSSEKTHSIGNRARVSGRSRSTGPLFAHAPRRPVVVRGMFGRRAARYGTRIPSRSPTGYAHTLWRSR